MGKQRMLAGLLLLGLAACDGAKHEEIIGPTVPVVVAEVRIAPATQRIELGGYVLLTATALDAEGREVTGRSCLWTSSDPQVAQVTAAGMVHGMRPGSATITATCDGVVGTGKITVASPPALDDQLGFRWAYEMMGADIAPVNDVWAGPDGVLFAAAWTGGYGCCGSVMRREQGVWTVETVPAATDLFGVWGSGSRDVFFVGGGILHFDGEALRAMPVANDVFLRDVWGSSATDVFAVGERGSILHYDGQVWTGMESGLDADAGWLNGIWGSSDRDVFVVGEHGTILHFDGHAWTRMASPLTTSTDLAGVWGSSGTDVYAVGTGGAILHYDGVAWAAAPSPTTQDLTAIHGNGPDEVFAVGVEHSLPRCCGQILRFDGSTWTAASSMTSMALFGVWSLPGQLFVVGSGPTILYGTRN